MSAYIVLANFTEQGIKNVIDTVNRPLDRRRRRWAGALSASGGRSVRTI